jgi:hypothetical protein
MRKSIRILAVAASVLVLGTAHAYKLVQKSGDAIDVYCDSGAFVGTMYWNGSRWSDGLRSDPDKDVVAKQMVAAQGSSCQ